MQVKGKGVSPSIPSALEIVRVIIIIIIPCI